MSKKNPCLNQVTTKKYLPKFFYPKISGIENLKPPKILRSSLSLEIRSTPPPPGGQGIIKLANNSYKYLSYNKPVEGHIAWELWESSMASCLPFSYERSQHDGSTSEY